LPLDRKRNYLPGDVIDFEIEYTGLLAAYNVDNITKKLCMIEAVNDLGKVRKGLGIDIYKRKKKGE
jgi:hypothetical protein